MDVLRVLFRFHLTDLGILGVISADFARFDKGLTCELRHLKGQMACNLKEYAICTV